MGQPKRVFDLVATLASVRRKCDECLRDHTDPAGAVDAITPLLSEADGEVHLMRSFAPGLGDVWDTLRAVLALAGTAAEWSAVHGGGGADEGLQPTARGATAVGGTDAGGSVDLGEEGVPADPDD